MKGMVSGAIYRQRGRRISSFELWSSSLQRSSHPGCGVERPGSPVVWIERRGRWCGVAGLWAVSTRGKMGRGAGETDGGQTVARRRRPCFGSEGGRG